MDPLTAQWKDQLVVLAATGYAAVLGGLIGLDREFRRKPAGLRTHMLVSSAAALIVGLGDLLAEHFARQAYHEMIRVDPMRLIQAIVLGVAFIGAGTISRAHGRVRGLTTASSVLVAVAIGIGAGLRMYIAALGATLLTLLVLRAVRRIETLIRTRDGAAHPEPDTED